MIARLHRMASSWLRRSTGTRSRPELQTVCSYCEQNPATCWACNGDEHDPSPYCGKCCDHGTAGGWCIPIADLPGWAATIYLNAEAVADERDSLREDLDRELERHRQRSLMLAAEQGRTAELRSQLAAAQAEIRRLVATSHPEDEVTS